MFVNVKRSDVRFSLPLSYVWSKPIGIQFEKKFPNILALLTPDGIIVNTRFNVFQFPN